MLHAYSQSGNLQQANWVTLNIDPASEIQLDVALTEARGIVEIAKSHKDNYPAALHIKHHKRLMYLGQHTRDNGRFSSMALPIRWQFDECRMIFDRQPNAKREQEIIFNLYRQDSMMSESQFQPETVHWNFSPIILYIAAQYILTILMAFGYHLSLLAWKGKPISSELTCPDLLIRSSVLWFMYFWYEAREPREQVQMVLKYAVSAICFIVSFCAQAGLGFAQKASGRKDGVDTTPTTDTIRFAFSTRTKTKYLGLDGGVFYPELVQQTGVTISAPEYRYLKNLTINLWNSSAPNNKPFASGFASELDLSVNWFRAIGGWNVGAGFIYLNTFPLQSLPRGDVVNVTFYLGKPITISPRISTEPYLYNWYAAPTKGNTPASGLFTHVGNKLRWNWKRLSADADIHVVRDSGASGYREGYLASLSSGIGIALKKGLVLRPIEWRTTIPIHIHDNRRMEKVFSWGFDYQFGF